MKVLHHRSTRARDKQKFCRIYDPGTVSLCLCDSVVEEFLLRKDEMAIKDPHDKQLREHLVYLLNGGGAHAHLTTW